MSCLSLGDLGAVGRIKVDAPYGIRPYRLGLKRPNPGEHLGWHKGVRRGVRRGLHRGQTGRLSGLGDVVDDAQTWITYGNDILGRSSASGVGAEAEKAGMNIDTFVGNRGDELAAASQDKLDELVAMKMSLLQLAAGKYKPLSVSGAFTDELGTALKQEVVAGAQGVAKAPGQAYDWAKQEASKAVDYALQKGGQAAKEAALPMALIVAGLAAVGFIVYQMKK